MKQISLNIFIFRRDLRIQDNTALWRMSRLNTKPILPLFIFNPQQIDPAKNPYYSFTSFNFMLECLQDLKDIIYFCEGNDISVLSKIYARYEIQSIGFNRDHTPFAKQRDQKIIEWCKEHSIPLVIDDDYVLFSYGDKQLRDVGHYEVFTPFYKKALKIRDIIRKPENSSIPQRRWFRGTVPNRITLKNHSQDEISTQRTIMGGRQNALQILAAINKGEFQRYDSTRNFPALNKTTKLSAYLKFGSVSIREVFWLCMHRYGKDHGLVRELLWREFYAHITWHVPRVLNGEPLKLKYKNKKLWEEDDVRQNLKAWCEGKTGFPFVDAGMRCLVQTGFLHNRLRMVVAMFLVKDLLIDWKEGERFFAKHLVDYDPASNSGGWQWAASVGADAQPYFRIFNPWLQSHKFDKDAVFIKQYIPELQQVPPKHIHEWHIHFKDYTDIDYPSPIIDHKTQTQKAIMLFNKLQTKKK